MNLVTSAMRRPLTVLVAIVAVALGAILAVRQMPRDVFPHLDIPTIYVVQPYAGMDPAQMEGYFTYYYEYLFLYIAGIQHVESRSIQGAALIKLQFYPGTDMAQAMAETVNYVNRARSFMPPGTVPPFVMRFDAGSVPVGDLVFSSKTRSVGEIQDAVLSRVRPLFATLPGVSAPPPFGGNARTIVINIHPNRLRGYGLSPEQVVSAIAAANVISPSGNIPLGGKYPMVTLNSVVKNIRALDNVPIRTGIYPAVYLRNIADVVDGSDITSSYALVNGRPTVYIPVIKRANASTLSVVNLVKKNIPNFQRVLPSGVTVSYAFDQSPYVTRAIAGLTLEGVLGALLTGLMILLFLRDWRSALIVVINIPLALLGAVLALWMTGQTINIMTLGGLTLAIGLLVDMSTVVIENIHTHLARGKAVARSVVDSGREVALPLLIAMMCVLAVFLPSFFMVGAARAIFLPLSLAVGFSMLASYLLSSTLAPTLSVWLLRGHEQAAAEQLSHTRGFAQFQRRYATVVERVVRARWLVVCGYLILTAGVIIVVGRQIGTEIFPQVNGGQLQVRLRAPAGTQIQDTKAIALKALDIIKQEVGPANVRMTLGFIGVPPSEYPINLIYLWNGGPEDGVLQVQFKPGSGIRIGALEERLRKVFAARMPDVRFSFEPSDIISRVMSFGSPTPIEVEVRGPNLATDRVFAEKVKTRLQTLPALRDVQFDQALQYPTVNVTVNRQRAGVMGVTMADVSRSLVPATSSSRFVVPLYWRDPKSGIAYQIQVQMPQARMDSIEKLKNTPISYGHHQTLLLRNIARLTKGKTVGEYDRFNMQRMITVTANLAPRTDLGGAATQVARALKELGTPPQNVTVAVRGQVVPMRQLLNGLRTGLILAAAVIFLLLAANFQSLRLSFIVVATVPAALAGVVLALWLTGTTLNVQSFMGAIMAVGVAVANAILLVTFAERNRMAGAEAGAAAIEGAQSRLRPILMTSLAMIAGMMPMTLGLGESGQQTAPLGRAVVGGLAAATLATLLVLPAIFAIMQARSRRRSASLDPDDPESSLYSPAR